MDPFNKNKPFEHSVSDILAAHKAKTPSHLGSAADKLPSHEVAKKRTTVKELLDAHESKVRHQEIAVILMAHGGLESNIPLNHRYWTMKH